MKPKVKFQWKGNHHAYYGIFFIVFGCFNWYMSIDNGILVEAIPFWHGIMVLGAYFVIDDIIEHTITEDTPLRWIYKKVVMPWLKRK